MNFFGEGNKVKLNPECPCCGFKYASLVAEGKNWKEWVCLKCRRVYSEKDNKIEVRGVLNG